MIVAGGFAIHKGWLAPAAQAAMAADIARVAEAAPFFAPLTPWGKPMSVRMTSAGRYGWYTDRKGYRYVDRHPAGPPWPPIPASVLAVWRALVSTNASRTAASSTTTPRMRAWACTATPTRRTFPGRCCRSASAIRRCSAWAAPAARIRPSPWSCKSGDVVIFGGPARLAYHGIDRIRFGGSTLLPDGGRINLTLRVVD